MSKDDSSCGRDSCGCGENDETADESFHPMGEDYEEEMREMLDDTEYDTELGMDMAEDAMALIQGEISEAEFHDKYNEAVVEEFDVDDRPTVDAFEEMNAEEDESIFKKLTGGGDIADKLAGLDADTSQSRRDTMKKMGAAGAALGLGGVASAQGGSSDPKDDEYGANPVGDTSDEGTQLGMVIDLNRCDGCLECVTGCIEENNTSSGANWMYVLSYEDESTEQENFLVRPCQHCTNAPCEKVCPVRARHTRDKDGIVLTNYETCIGCRYCQVACPYGVNYFQWGEPDTPFDELMGADGDYDEDSLKEMDYEQRNQLLTENNDHIYDERGMWSDSRPPQGVMGKCTMCPTRQDGHSGEEKQGTVACMEACDAAGMSAIHFGDVNDPESRPRQYMRQRAEQEFARDTELDNGEQWGETVTPWAKLSAFKLLEDLGTRPNITYLGNQPGPEAEQVEGPVSYEQIGVTDNRKEHLDQYTFGAGDD